MTTTVIIKSPFPNHHDISIEVLGAMDSDGHSPLLREVRLTDGQEQQFYVYSGQTLSISEIAKELHE